MATFEYQCYGNVNKRILSFLLSMYGACLKICKSVMVSAIESFEHCINIAFCDILLC